MSRALCFSSYPQGTHKSFTSHQGHVSRILTRLTGYGLAERIDIDSKSPTSRGDKMRQNLTSIVAIDRKGAIGCQNRLPWSIKSDLAFFRKTTTGNNVIMGRKTYESIGDCLPNRMNFVLSHNAVLFEEKETCKVACSIGEALALASRYDEHETFVIGGAATYKEFAPFIDRYLITRVDHVADGADAFLDEEIRTEFGTWTCDQLAHYPAIPGKDEFSFSILEFLAPDAGSRREHRKAVANQFLAKALNSKQPKSTRRGSTKIQAQTAFLF